MGLWSGSDLITNPSLNLYQGEIQLMPFLHSKNFDTQCLFTRIFRLLVILVSCIAFLHITDVSASNITGLTADEISWIKEHQAVRVGNETDWPPFDFTKNGDPSGFSIDYIRLVAEKVGLKLNFVNGYSWDELLRMFKARDLDILPAIYVSEERLEYAAFTPSYYAQPSVILINTDDQITKGLDDLNGRQVAAIKGFTITNVLAEKYPDIELLIVDNMMDGVMAVSTGEAAAFIDSVGVLSYFIQNNFIPNVKFIRDRNLNNIGNPALHMAVAKEKSMLHSILVKGMRLVNESEMQKLTDRWLHLSYSSEQQDASRAKKKLAAEKEDSSSLPVTVFVFLIAGIIVFAFVRLWRGQGEKKATLIALILLLLALIGVALYVFYHYVENGKEIAAAKQGRFDSLNIVDHLRQTSDDLTRMARTYVVTGESRYEDYFNKILDIRNGMLPRPVDYDHIYWDYVTATGRKPREDGEPLALETLMEQMGFTDEEFNLLRGAKRRSDKLAVLEEQAMQAIKGLSRDETGGYAKHIEPDYKLAQSLLHGSDYHLFKSEIMGFIEQVSRNVDVRTQSEVDRLMRRSNELAVTASLLGMGAILIISLLLLLAAIWMRAAESEVPAKQADSTSKEMDSVWHMVVTGLVRTWPLFLTALLVAALITGITWRSRLHLEHAQITELESLLTTVLNSTNKAVRVYLKDLEDEVRIWAQHEGVANLVAALSEMGVDSEALRYSSEQTSLQLQLGHLMNERGYTGYLVVKPTGLILSSSNYSYIGRWLDSEAERA